jgi:hypothetical protein
MYLCHLKEFEPSLKKLRTPLMLMHSDGSSRFLELDCGLRLKSECLAYIDPPVPSITKQWSFAAFVGL